MARGFKRQVHDAITAAAGGSEVSTGGHTSLAFAISAANLDTGNDTLSARLEVKIGDEWSPILDSGGNAIMAVTASDFVDVDSDGDYTVYMCGSGIPGDIVRLNVYDVADNAGADLAIDAYVMGAGWVGPRKEYKEQ